MSVTSLKKSSNSVEFKIVNKKENDFEIALINGLRRIILVNLETYCFDRDKIDILRNTSIYNEDFLTQRLSLVPLNYKELSKLDISKLQAHLNVSNSELVEIKNFYASDIKIYYGDTDKPIEERKLLDTNKLITLPSILLVSIKPEQHLDCMMEVKKGSHKEDGSMYCGVSKCVYYFEPDEKEFIAQMSKLDATKQKEMAPILREQLYKKNGDVPAIYNFSIETDDILPVKDVFVYACDYLINLLKGKIEEIRNIDASLMVKIETSPTNMFAYDFVFERSDDTLGNILQTYGMREKDIKYIGYHVPHPLDRRLYVRIAMEEKLGRNVYEKKVIELMQKVIKLCEGLKRDYLNALK